MINGRERDKRGEEKKLHIQKEESASLKDTWPLLVFVHNKNVFSNNFFFLAVTAMATTAAATHLPNMNNNMANSAN